MAAVGEHDRVRLEPPRILDGTNGSRSPTTVSARSPSARYASVESGRSRIASSAVTSSSSVRSSVERARLRETSGSLSSRKRFSRIASHMPSAPRSRAIAIVSARFA